MWTVVVVVGDAALLRCMREGGGSRVREVGGGVRRLAFGVG
jgi:hypothetical protein